MANELILVIDDEVETIELLSTALGRRGYEVISATDGEEGLQLIRERKPALLLLDLMMPRLSGYEVCSQLRADPQTADLPILVLSASGTLAAEKDALAAGANRFVLKPVSLKVLMNVVESMLNEKR